MELEEVRLVLRPKDRESVIEDLLNNENQHKELVWDLVSKGIAAFGSQELFNAAVEEMKSAIDGPIHKNRQVGFASTMSLITVALGDHCALKELQLQIKEAKKPSVGNAEKLRKLLGFEHSKATEPEPTYSFRARMLAAQAHLRKELVSILENPKLDLARRQAAWIALGELRLYFGAQQSEDQQLEKTAENLSLEALIEEFNIIQSREETEDKRQMTLTVNLNKQLSLNGEPLKINDGGRERERPLTLKRQEGRALHSLACDGRSPEMSKGSFKKLNAILGRLNLRLTPNNAGGHRLLNNDGEEIELVLEKV